MRLIAWGTSDAGQRDHNEDSFLIDEPMGLFAVADGMGGHLGGETASRMALEVLKRMVAGALDDLAGIAARLEEEWSLGRQDLAGTGAAGEPGSDEGWRDQMGRAPTAPMGVPAIESPATMVMRAAAEEAGLEIFGTGCEDPRLRGMGTTLTAMLFHGGDAHLVHAGDSRAYLFRDDHLRQLTEDHSWIAEQVRRGNMSESEARQSHLRHVITRSVGFEREVELDTTSLSVQAGDCFLLCSDGMSNHVENHEIERLLRRNWYRRAPQRFVDLANQRGGDDNITVVLVQAANDATRA